MDLNTIGSVLHPAERSALPQACSGDAFLAGGTWLFSEPQRHLRRLIDLASLGWPAIEPGPAGLRLAATCTLAQLDDHAATAGGPAAGAIRACCRALWGSFKIRNAATIGGNLCLALPAAPMAALLPALDARCLVWRPDGGERVLPAAAFVRGPGRNALAPGELLRAVAVPAAVLRDRFAVRQASLLQNGRSAALLVGRRHAGGISLVVAAALPRPLRLDLPALPDRDTLCRAIDRGAIETGWFDDVHGAPDWRRHMTLRLAGEILEELAG